MSNHLADLVRLIVQRLRPAPKADPLTSLDGLDVPEGLVGKDFDIFDSQSRVVASTRRQHSAQTRAMIG